MKKRLLDKAWAREPVFILCGGSYANISGVFVYTFITLLTYGSTCCL